MTRETRHVLLFLGSLVAAGAFYRLLGTDDLLWWMSMWSAYASLFLLAWSLAIGPWNVLRGRRNPVSGYFRRDIGIWAGALGIVHVVFGLQVHFRGRMWLYFVPDGPSRIPIRLDPFGLTNWAGVAATLILVLLLALSNDASIRKLGGPRWKWLQRWNYACAALVVGHGAIYQVIEGRAAGLVVACALIVATSLALQVAGFRARRARPS